MSAVLTVWTLPTLCTAKVASDYICLDNFLVLVSWTTQCSCHLHCTKYQLVYGMMCIGYVKMMNSYGRDLTVHGIWCLRWVPAASAAQTLEDVCISDPFMLKYFQTTLFFCHWRFPGWSSQDFIQNVKETWMRNNTHYVWQKREQPWLK